MGLFAFRRMKEREAAVNAAALASSKPIKKNQSTTLKADGSNDRRNSGRRKRQQLSDPS